MMQIGFIGLGTMGLPMATNLIKKGYNVTVYNRTSSKTESLKAIGAKVAESPADAAKDSDVVFTMLSNDAVLLDVFYGENGILQGLKTGATVIDSSTVAAHTSQKLYGDIKSMGAHFLDAPVTGSKPAAEAGTLIFMVGGDEEVVDAHRELLSAVGNRVVYMGPSGSGSFAKLAHNTIVGINMAGLAEGLAVAVSAGLDPEAFLQVVLNGAGNSRQAELKGSKIVNRDFSNQFSLGLMLKDLLLANELSGRFQLPMPMLRSASSLFQMGYSKGLGDVDLCSVVQIYEDWMNQPVAKREEAATLEAFDGDRRRSTRVPMNIKLHIAVHQWQNEGSFQGQTIEGTLNDISDNGMQIVSPVPLSEEMFIVLHFPQIADLPPITSKIIRVEAKDGLYYYGCMISGITPYVRIKLEQYIRSCIESME